MTTRTELEWAATTWRDALELPTKRGRAVTRVLE